MSRAVVVLAVLAISSLAAGQLPGPSWAPDLVSVEEAAEGFYPLFNGSDLNGWEVVGPDRNAFVVRAGALCFGGSHSTRLISDQQFENVVVRYEYRSDANGARPSLAVGALETLPSDFVEAEKPREWNWVDVVCDEGRIRSSVNGCPVLDAAREDACGAIVVSGGSMGELRRIRVKPLPGGPGWRPLCAEAAQWHDFELRLWFRPSEGGRGSVFLRKNGKHPGYEVCIDNGATEFITGSIRNFAEATELRSLDDCWNALRVVARGRNIQVEVNGKRVLDFVGTARRGTRAGRVEVEDGGGAVQFKDIEIRPISQERK